MANGMAELDAMIAKLRQLPRFVEQSAPAVAEAVHDQFKKQIAAGTDANGKPWKLTEEGKKPMPTADKALVVVPVGKTVFCKLKGHIARHHRGIARGGIGRPIFPEKGLPPTLAKVIKSTMVDKFNETMK